MPLIANGPSIMILGFILYRPVQLAVIILSPISLLIKVMVIFEFC